MSVTFSDPAFQRWANAQIPKQTGPARYVMWMYLLRKIWEKDPSTRRFARAALTDWTEPAYEQEFTDRATMPRTCP